MRIPYPERIPLFPVLTFCLVLALLQQLQGTTLLFSACTATFIVLATIAFNVSGGLSRTSGAFIFAYAVLGVIFGIVYKVIVGEAAQTNLLQPELTPEVYVGTMASILLIAYINRRLRRKTGILPQFSTNEQMRRAAISSFFLGMVPFAIHLLAPTREFGGLTATILRLLEGFLPLGMVLGVTAEIRRSGGSASMTTFTLIAGAITFFQSIISFSKGGLFYAFAGWLLPAATQRYKISLLQLASILVSLGWITYYLVPYCQYGRDFALHSESITENLKVNLTLLENLGQVRTVYMANTAERYAGLQDRHYYNEPQGLADRVQMITPDDQLIDATEQGSVFGLVPTIYSFYNLVPHFLWPNKPSANFGTIYAREMGVLSEEDETTGISFSPSSDAYHQAKWPGVLILLPVLLLMAFLSMDSVCGDIRQSPFPLLVVLGLLHGAPEGGLGQCASEIGGLYIFYGLAFVCVRVLPFFAGLLLGPTKEDVAPRGATGLLQQ